MTTHNSEPLDSSDRSRGTPAELYERHFVPQIGLPCAEVLVEAARLAPGERVIDVACGTGVAARLAAERVGPEGTVAGIDGHGGMLAVARMSTDAPIDWREANASGLPYGDETYHVALCSLGLQFFADRVCALTEMRRVVGETGRIAVGVPGPTPPLMQELHDALATHVGAGAAAFVQAVFALDDPDRLAHVFEAGGSGVAEVTSHRLVLDLDPPVEFLWQYVLGTPLAGAVEGLDAQRLRALEDDVVERWHAWESGVGMAMAVDLHIAIA